jgi:Na+-transporting NADH:ubiquinone oxidoreductase subunit F
MPDDATIEFHAGDYVQVTCPAYRLRFRDLAIDAAYHATWDRLGLWRLEAASSGPIKRAYSMANAPVEQGTIMLNVRLAIPPANAPDGTPPGVVSSYLFSVEPGDSVTVAGPYGNFRAQESDREMVFIGGGAGMAPMRSHIVEQLRHLHTKRTITFWYGARSGDDVFYRQDFDRLQQEFDNFRWTVALSEPRPEDEWAGPVGFIHQVVYDTYLSEHPAPEECEYYLCGPPMMIKAVRNMLDSEGVEPESIFYDDFGG